MQSNLVVDFQTISNDTSVVSWLPSRFQLLFSTTTSLPPSFFIRSEAYELYAVNSTLDTLFTQVNDAIGNLSNNMAQRRLQQIPFLLVLTPLRRSPGPGILNPMYYLGLNSESVLQLGQLTNSRFALEAYGRFWHTFGCQVLDIPATVVEETLDPLVAQFHTNPRKYQLSELVAQIDTALISRRGISFPTTIEEQLKKAILTLYTHWRHRLTTTTSENTAKEGPAIYAQVVVLGNISEASGTGIVYSRHPYTGVGELHGEFVPGAHFEEAVSGAYSIVNLVQFKKRYPSVCSELAALAQHLEQKMRHLVQITFLVEEGRLYVLDADQGRSRDRARLKIAVDLADINLISQAEAIRRVPSTIFERLLQPTLASDSQPHIVAHGLPAGPGIVSGQVVFDPIEAQRWAAQGQSVILVRGETFPQDFTGIVAAKGLLTTKGGTTSHASVVARGLGKVCIVGANAVIIDEATETLQIGQHNIRKGETLTINGTNGDIILGAVNTVEPEPQLEMLQLLSWADELRTLGVRANIDTPDEALLARKLGADGIGLCRIEHLCLRPKHLTLLQQIILRSSDEARNVALNQLQALLHKDFTSIFVAMSGYPVTIRLLDPPLHEFLPHHPNRLEVIAQALNMEVEKITKQMETFRETNPMMGLRGCRLTVVQSDLLAIQIKAIFGAALDAYRQGCNVHPEIMIPFVMNVSEVQEHVQHIHTQAKAIEKDHKVTFNYKVGTMIELPRATLIADEIARYVDFFSFGTNDLTQTTLGMSRDDAASFLPDYIARGWLTADPFQVIDRQGVGKLMQEAVRLGRSTRPDLDVGICGEHGSNPESIAFCQEIGLNYVSCSPLQIFTARLVAAQATLQ